MASFSKKNATYSTTLLKSSSLPDTAPEIPKKKEIPEGLWEKCKKCDEIIFTKQKEEELCLCPK